MAVKVCSHDDTILVVLPFLEAFVIGVASRDTRVARGCCPDDRKTLLCTLVPLVGSANIPDIGFKRVSAAADAHFCEVADCVLSLWVA
jgi:hypothetical protein